MAMLKTYLISHVLVFATTDSITISFTKIISVYCTLLMAGSALQSTGASKFKTEELCGVEEFRFSLLFFRRAMD